MKSMVVMTTLALLSTSIITTTSTVIPNFEYVEPEFPIVLNLNKFDPSPEIYGDEMTKITI